VSLKFSIPARDKILHMICGFLLSCAGFIWLPLCVLGLIAGAGKEIYDKTTGRGYPDLEDFIYTLAGAYLGTLIAIIPYC